MKNVQKILFVLFILIFGLMMAAAGFVLGKNMDDDKKEEVTPSPTPTVSPTTTPTATVVPTVTPTGPETTKFVLDYTFNNIEKSIVLGNPENYDVTLSQNGKIFTLTYKDAKLILSQTNSSYQATGQGFTADESNKINDNIYRTKWTSDTTKYGYNISKEGNCGDLASPCFNFNLIDSTIHGYFIASITFPSNATSAEITDIYNVFDSLIANMEIN
jgi:hypothetical protein